MDMRNQMNNINEVEFTKLIETWSNKELSYYVKSDGCIYVELKVTKDHIFNCTSNDLQFKDYIRNLPKSVKLFDVEEL